MRAWPLPVLPVLVLLLAAQVGTGVAVGASGWASEAEFEGLAQLPRVALGADGEAAAVWEGGREDGFRVHGSWRDADGAWSRPVAFAADAFEPTVAFGPEGDALALWSGPRGIEAASGAPARGWSKRALVAREEIALGPELAIDGAGEAIAIWRRMPVSGGSSIRVSTRSPGGRWSAPARVSRGKGDAASADLAVTPGGEAIAVWWQKDGRRSVVRASSRPRGGHWSRPVDLSVPGENAVAPRVAIDPAGEAVAVWRRFDGAHGIVQAASRPRGGGWSHPVDLSRRGRNAERPRIAIYEGGEALAVWERFDGRNELIEAASRPAGRSWSSPARLSKPGRSAHAPSLATSSSGASVVVWERSGADGPVIQAATRSAAGGWSAPALVASSAGSAQPAVALGPEGEALAAWGGYSLGIAALAAP
ncbi:MAG: hypothetical protein QM729_05585 [Solirubrobacterales bacterium]